MRFFWVRMEADEARDLTQRVFLSAYESLRAERGPGSDLEGWAPYLFQSARNLWIDQTRRAGAQPGLQSLESLLDEDRGDELASSSGNTEAGGAETLCSRELRHALRECLEELDVETRASCWMHFVQGASKRSIGRATNRPEATVRTRIARALQSLRACLERRGMAPEP